MYAELLVLRIVHVVGGVFWVGTVLFTWLFLMPAMAQAGPAAGKVMAGIQQRRLMTWLPAVAVLTMLSGLRLMWIVSAGDPHWFVHRVGHTFSVSGALAIVAFVIGMVVNRPAMLRAGKLSQSAASDEASRERIAQELRALQRRAYVGTVTVGVLLTLSAIGMAIARYV